MLFQLWSCLRKESTLPVASSRNLTSLSSAQKFQFLVLLVRMGQPKSLWIKCELMSASFLAFAGDRAPSAKLSNVHGIIQPVAETMYSEVYCMNLYSRFSRFAWRVVWFTKKKNHKENKYATSGYYTIKHIVNVPSHQPPPPFLRKSSFRKAPRNHAPSISNIDASPRS